MIEIVDQAEVQRAANAALAMISHPLGVTPNAVRGDISGLETLIGGILSGTLVVVVSDSLPRAEPDNGES